MTTLELYYLVVVPLVASILLLLVRERSLILSLGVMLFIAAGALLAAVVAFPESRIPAGTSMTGLIILISVPLTCLFASSRISAVRERPFLIVPVGILAYFAGVLAAGSVAVSFGFVSL